MVFKYCGPQWALNYFSCVFVKMGILFCLHNQRKEKKFPLLCRSLVDETFQTSEISSPNTFRFHQQHLFSCFLHIPLPSSASCFFPIHFLKRSSSLMINSFSSFLCFLASLFLPFLHSFFFWVLLWYYTQRDSNKAAWWVGEWIIFWCWWNCEKNLWKKIEASCFGEVVKF